MIAPADTDALPPGVATENEALDVRLASIRRAFVEKLWSGMLLLAAVGVPISVSRAWSTGWLDVYSLQVALGVGVALVYRGRRRLSQGWLSGLLSASARNLGHASRGDGNLPVRRVRHDAGDAILCAAASRMLARLRASDTVARIGGDEFLILLPDMKDAAAAGPIARSLIESLSAPYPACGNTVSIGASIGIAIYPDDGLTGAELRRMADAAMYEAKRHGKGSFRYARA